MTSRDVCVDGFTEVKTDAVGESRGSAENGGERNGRRLGLASTETKIAQQVFTNGEERNGHGDADLDDCCKVTRTALHEPADGCSDGSGLWRTARVKHKRRRGPGRLGDADLDDDLLSEGGTTVVSGEARRL